mgnify:CR=1 FL=1
MTLQKLFISRLKTQDSRLKTQDSRLKTQDVKKIQPCFSIKYF